jgi:hypothetical protein
MHALCTAKRSCGTREAHARRRAPAKLLLIATTRTTGMESHEHPMNSVKHELLMHRLCRAIELTPLAETDVAEYLVGQSKTRDLPAGLSALVHRHCDGNPLFMVAAIEHLTKRGLISCDTGRWELRVALETIDLEVPDRLGQMIEARIARLSKEEQRVLEAASITGTTFSPRVNAASANIHQACFEEICETLARRHAIVRFLGTRQFPNTAISSRYEFVHAMYREVLYLGRLLAGARLSTGVSAGDWRCFLPTELATWRQNLPGISNGGSTTIEPQGISASRRRARRAWRYSSRGECAATADLAHHVSGGNTAYASWTTP